MYPPFWFLPVENGVILDHNFCDIKCKLRVRRRGILRQRRKRGRRMLAKRRGPLLRRRRSVRSRRKGIIFVGAMQVRPWRCYLQLPNLIGGSSASVIISHGVRVNASTISSCSSICITLLFTLIISSYHHQCALCINILFC